MIGSKPENSRCEPAQLDKYKNALSTYICIKVTPGIPHCLWGGLSIWTAKAIRHIYIYENTWYAFQSQKEQQLNQHKGKLAAWFFSPIIERLRVEILKKN